MFKNIFFLHTSAKIVNLRYLTLASSIISSPCILEHKTTISSTPICYVKCHKVYIFHLKDLLMLTNNIILTLCRCDTLRSLGI